LIVEHRSRLRSPIALAIGAASPIQVAVAVAIEFTMPAGIISAKVNRITDYDNGDDACSL
jgi:hypothetical protein